MVLDQLIPFVHFHMGQVWVNMADAMVSSAEQHSDSGEVLQARQSYSQAMDAYETACSMSSSDAGDDLPGLLHNWGVGLYSMGTHLRVRQQSLSVYQISYPNHCNYQCRFIQPLLVCLWLPLAN